MNFGGIEICCPVCRDELAKTGQDLTCKGCGRAYPVIAGIPDLRVFADPYIGIEADRQKAVLLAERSARETFEGLIDFYYSVTSAVPPQHARLYKRSLMAGPARAEVSLNAWEAASGVRKTGRLLEIGCGTGPLLLAAAQRGYQVVGVDIAFRWLIVAKKRLAEAGLDIPLICACAEALPFREATFDRVALDSAIEMVADPAKAMSEAYRALTSEGHLFLTTPNRFSLGPDPHLGVPAGGLWPKALLAAVARRQGAVPPLRNLLWARSLVRLIRSAGFAGTRLELPNIDRAQVRDMGQALQAAVAVYRTARRIPLTRSFLFLVGPLLHATARKS